MVENNNHTYMSVNDVEDTDRHNTAGVWRNDPALTCLPACTERNATGKAKMQRNELTDYFTSDYGSVPWQEYMVTH